MKKFVTLLLSTILLLLFVAGCQPADSTISSGDASPSANASKTEQELFDERFKELETKYSEFIDSVKIPAEKEMFSSNLPQYFKYPDHYDKLSMVGLEGVPVLIEKSLEYEVGWVIDEDGNMTAALLAMARSLAVSGILRVDSYNYYAPHKDNYVDANDRHLVLYNFIQYSDQDLSEAFESELSPEARMDVYRKYGLMSVPFVKKELEKGNTEFEEYFLLVGAHIDTEEFFKITETTIITDAQGNKDRHTPTKEEEIAALAEHEKAETFDYKVWLEENEEDLNFLYEYLDAYCEEYEAKNK